MPELAFSNLLLAADRLRLDNFIEGLRAVAFDFDGTLAEPVLDFAELRRRVDNLVRTLDLPRDSPQRNNSANLPVMEWIRAVKKELGKDRDAVQGAVFEQRAFALVKDTEIEAARRCRLFSFSLPLLERLKAKKIGVVIVTRNCREAVELVFPEWRGFADHLLAREDVARHKPHPEHLLLGLERLRVIPANALMVGDHPQDILLGKNAGVKTAGVCSGQGSLEELRRLKPDFIAADAGELFRDIGI